MSRDDIIKERIGFTGDELRSRLRQYDRAPFTEVLAKFMECMPSEAALIAFARRSPDKYISALATIQRMAGYTDKTESTLNVNLAVAVSRMSDSQLEDKLRSMGIDPDKVVDLEVAPLENPATNVDRNLIKLPANAPNDAPVEPEAPEPSAAKTQ
jgi:hypothetical protein